MKALALVSDAFGGRGGIAHYNRHLLKSLCDYPQMEYVLAIPRNITYGLEAMPDNLRYRLDAAGGKLRYLYTCLRTIRSEPHFDLIICGHLHLLPLSRLLGMFYGCPVLPIIYGVEAWSPTSGPLINYFCRHLTHYISIRRLTAKRLIKWANLPHEHYYYLPNCIDPSKYGIRPKNKALMERYGILNKRVVMTAGRLDPLSCDERKGFDEIIEILPTLKKAIPNIVYLIMGDGNDRNRLIEKAKNLGVGDSVIFTGYVSDAEKADHYRLADVFAMPGSGAMFDRYPYRFVFLEALACGVPVIGSRVEDPWEINDPQSQLLMQVNPNSKNEIIEAIITALSRPKGILRPGLERFYVANFKAAFHSIIKEILVKRESHISENNAVSDQSTCRACNIAP